MTSQFNCCNAQILVTELGDETFIIAAIMAMRHPRLTVYAGAMSALGLMTVSPPPTPESVQSMHVLNFMVLAIYSLAFFDSLAMPGPCLLLIS